MSDPAVEAAQRVWTARYFGGTVELLDSVSDDGIGALAVSSAREALAPIRLLHYPVSYAKMVNPQPVLVCAHCHHPRIGYSAEPEIGAWPCVTAHLAYTSEELAQ